MHILLVEDDIGLGNVLLKILKQSYRVDWVRTLEQATNHTTINQYSLILLDLGLPDGDGIQWLTQWRAHGHDIPILIISARDALEERIKGLDNGADDYLIKPFESEELQARIRVLLRREARQATTLIQAGDLTYDPSLDRFNLHNEPLNLPPKEHQLLTVLIHSLERPVSRARLLQQIYSFGNEAESNTLDVHIHALRKILGKEHIQTLRGIGYQLVNICSSN